MYFIVSTLSTTSLPIPLNLDWVFFFFFFDPHLDWVFAFVGCGIIIIMLNVPSISQYEIDYFEWGAAGFILDLYIVR